MVKLIEGHDNHCTGRSQNSAFECISKSIPSTIPSLTISPAANAHGNEQAEHGGDKNVFWAGDAERASLWRDVGNNSQILEAADKEAVEARISASRDSETVL
jgi:hypothetical protein